MKKAFAMQIPLSVLRGGALLVQTDEDDDAVSFFVLR